MGHPATDCVGADAFVRPHEAGVQRGRIERPKKPAPDECVRGYALVHDLDYFDAKTAPFYDQPADRHRQLEAPRAGAAGIEVEHAVARLLLRTVAVAGDHDFESRSLGFQVKLRKIVQNIDGDAAEFDDFRFRKFARPRRLVDIAPDGGYGRN
jgi:hypothetical protein